MRWRASLIGAAVSSTAAVPRRHAMPRCGAWRVLHSLMAQHTRPVARTVTWRMHTYSSSVHMQTTHYAVHTGRLMVTMRLSLAFADLLLHGTHE
jgi:hypothetical protein